MTERRSEPLTADTVLTAAIALVDAHGLEQLTMRRLGTALGVEAMSLYRYFPSRRQLVDGLVEAVVLQTATDPELQLIAGGDWRDYLQRLAHGTRRMALTHPRIFPLIATHPTEAPWIKPPLRSVRWVDAFLTGLQEHGFPTAATVTVYKQFSTFLLGHLLLEVAALGLDHESLASSPPPPPDPVKREAELQRVVADEPSVAFVERSRRAETPACEVSVVLTDGLDVPITDTVVSTAGMSLRDYPVVESLAGLLAHDTAARDFAETLAALLERFGELRLSAPAAAPRAGSITR